MNFEEIVEKYEYEFGIKECLYEKTIKEFSSLTLDKLNVKRAKIIIKYYLHDWGSMTRVIPSRNFIDIIDLIQKNSNEIKYLRKYKFTDNLSIVRTKIIDIFDKFSQKEFKKGGTGLKKRFGDVFASKILHLCIPDLFIMWDTRIKNSKNLNGTGNDYFQFLLQMKDLYIKLKKTILALSIKYNRPITKIIDEYNWYEANRSLKS
ncbi:MAG: hypothetical protein ACTSPQ_10255 [Candidatus Helarchaeota archaeon]